MDLTVIVKQKVKARQQKVAMKQMNDLVSLLGNETCGQVEVEKPKDVFQLLFENIDSLGVFATGEARGSKQAQTDEVLAEQVKYGHGFLR